MSTSKPIEPVREIFKVRVVYKSGYTHDFEVYNFKIKNGTYEWESVDIHNQPIRIGADEIAAIWQVGVR